MPLHNTSTSPSPCDLDMANTIVSAKACSISNNLPNLMSCQVTGHVHIKETRTNTQNLALTRLV